MNPVNPLSRRVRVGLYWLLVLVFIVGTPILIGYSKGYRLDDALSLIQTGGIYIHSDMARTTVYLDGDFIEENGALLKNTLIQDLSPNRTYEVWVEKEGYQSWTKELLVRPNLVTEASVLMLPERFEWATVTASTTIPVSDPLLGPSSSTTKEVANPRFGELTEYFLESRDQFAIEVATTTTTLIKGKEVATTTIILELDFPSWLKELASTSALYNKTEVRERNGIVTWLDAGNVHAVWARENDVPPYYFCNATCTPVLIIDWREDIDHYDFYPNRNDVLVIGSDRGVYAVELDDRSQRNIQPFTEEPGLDFRILPNGTLVTYDGKEFRETTW